MRAGMYCAAPFALALREFVRPFWTTAAFSPPLGVDAVV